MITLVSENAVGLGGPADPKEVSIFKTLYGEARINERIHAQLFRLILGCILKYKPGDVLCPRLIFQTYFDVMGFKAGSGEEILNCRLTRNGKAARPNRPNRPPCSITTAV